MKKRILALLLATTMLVGTACSSGGSNNNGGTEGAASNNDGASEASNDEASASSGGGKESLIWVQGADVTSMDPHQGKETPAVQVTCNIFDTLMLVDATGSPQACLAESWEQVDDVTWNFKLREDVKFHDGEPMTSEDVVFSLNRAINSPAVSYIVDFIDTVEADGDFGVVIKTKAPYAPILANLAVPFSAIVPKHLVEADEENFVLNPVGTGAYKFEEWKQGDYVKLSANEDYWRGAPVTKNLQMKVVPEAAQRTIAIETGEADFAYDIPSNDVSKVEGNDNLQIFVADPLSVWYISFNMNKEPFNNEKVRQAIHHAIDKESILQAVRYGMGDVANSLIPPAAFGYSTKSMVYDYDVEKAKALLAEAGYPDGFSCQLWVNENQERVESCQIIQSQLKQIGIEVEISVMEFGTYIEETSAGKHDIAYFGWTCSTADADYNYYSLLHSTQQGAPGNRSFINDPKVDELVESGRSTSDPSARQAIYDELEEYLGPISPSAYLFYSTINVGASNKVSGFVMDPNGYHHLYTVAVAE